MINRTLTTQYFKYLLLLGLIIFFSLNSFAGPKAPEFIRTKDWKIEKLSSGNIALTAKAVFYNSNKAKAKLREVNLDVFLNDKLIGVIHQTNTIKIQGKSSFDIPLRMEFNLLGSGLDIVSSVLTLLTNKKFLVDMKGFTKMNVFCLPFKIKIDERQEFSSKDFI